ncbi:GNAT family N-acetyltransferase [Paenibacillus eucommiae]|uniref:Ribosomal protein S18 acetylase RimI-like enzyme n=1 Tax=Paenibacillus eucommiae TaxID=1355755 RepID=A0ABS4ITL6_9BACL|nr:GNAT family N-acetyltransferase [Paenibacillus eucommiae]MBP1990921.1 ribosomal protein S18 acetylase RimI-like enzyme [Paenibacillus eucommiae]
MMGIKRLSLKSNEEVLQLLSLQLASYQIEAKLTGASQAQMLPDGIQSLRAAKESFLGFFKLTGGKKVICGAISYSRDGSVVTICRLMVHPEHFRQGIARSLLDYVLADQRAKRASRFVVSACAANLPAVQLYTSSGFVERRTITIKSNITLTTFERSADS